MPGSARIHPLNGGTMHDAPGDLPYLLQQRAAGPPRRHQAIEFAWFHETKSIFAKEGRLYMPSLRRQSCARHHAPAGKLNCATGLPYGPALFLSFT
jgi:hypothetical protein